MGDDSTRYMLKSMLSAKSTQEKQVSNAHSDTGYLNDFLPEKQEPAPTLDMLKSCLNLNDKMPKIDH